MHTLILGNGQLGKILMSHFNMGKRCVCNNKLYCYCEERAWDNTNTMFQGRVEDLKMMGGKNFLVNGSFPDVIINTVAISNTRTCEADWDSSCDINVNFPISLAEMLSEFQNKYNLRKPTHLVHISTGCIYDGNSESNFEDSEPTPLINYSKQKLLAESIRDIYEYATILRPRMLFSDLNLPSNLLEKVNGFTRLLDEPNSMTCCYDLSNVIEEVVKKKWYGTLNVCNKGTSSAYQIKAMMEVDGTCCDIERISKEELLQAMNGLKLTNTWIESHYLDDLYVMPSVQDRLREMIELSKNWL